HLVQEDGGIDAKAHAGANWKAAMIPVLDPDEPLEASIQAKRFRAAALLPLVETSFTELDGRVDADAKVALDPKTRTAKASGTIRLSEGRFELAAVGGEFHDATATLRFTPDGVITLENARAYGMSGRIEAAASARVDSRGLASAAARIVIPQSSPLL